MYNQENPRRAGRTEQEPIHKLDEALSALECEIPFPSHTSRALSALAAVITDDESAPQFRPSQEELKITQYYCKKLHSKQWKTVCGTIFYRNTEAEGELIEAYYQVIEKVLINMAEKKTLNKTFDCNIELWTSCTWFMGAFAVRVLSPSLFVRTVSSIGRTRMDKTVKE